MSLSAKMVALAGRVPPGTYFQDRGLDEDVEQDLEGDATQNGSDHRIKVLEANQALQALTSDPDIRKVLELKRAGKAFVINDPPADEEVEETPEEVDDLKDIPADDPARKTLERINSLIETKLGRLMGGVDKKLGVLDTLSERLQGVEGIATTVQKKEVNDQVAKARDQFKDFDKYKDKILEISKTIPGLSVAELYILAKQRSGDLKVSVPSTFSERPSSQPRKLGERPSPKKPVRPPGRSGFNQFLGEALNGLDLEKQE